MGARWKRDGCKSHTGSNPVSSAKLGNVQQLKIFYEKTRLVRLQNAPPIRGGFSVTAAH